MAQRAPITINDGQATPVAVTFTPEEITSGLATFVDRTPGISLAFRRLGASFKAAKGASKVNRSKYTVDVPVTTVVDGVTSVAHTMRVNVECIFHEAATTANRKDAFAFALNGLANPIILGCMRDLDPVY